MKKYVILSVNDNPKYLFHVPLTVWAWRYFGWEPIVFVHASLTQSMFSFIRAFCFDTGCLKFHIRQTMRIDGYSDETITQVSRLYGASIPEVAEDYLMTGDIDMIPLSDYWKPDENKLTVYGRDLTDYHYPICYIGMDSEKWKEVMNIDGDDYQYYMQRDLMTMPHAKGPDKVKRWVTDQDLITEKINNSHFVPERVDRGTDKRTGYPIGRVDRSHWTLNHDVFIDAHLPHDVLTNDESFKKILALLHHVWPKEDWKWWIEYYREFKKLMK